MEKSPTDREKYTLYLTEQDFNNLLTLIYPDYKAEIEELKNCIGDYILLKKALIYGRLVQMQQLREQENAGIDADFLIKHTFINGTAL